MAERIGHGAWRIGQGAWRKGPTPDPSLGLFIILE